MRIREPRQNRPVHRHTREKGDRASCRRTCNDRYVTSLDSTAASASVSQGSRTSGTARSRRYRAGARSERGPLPQPLRLQPARRLEAREPARGGEPRQGRRIRLAAPEPRSRVGSARRGIGGAARCGPAGSRDRTGKPLRSRQYARAGSEPRLPDVAAWTDSERLLR